MTIKKSLFGIIGLWLLLTISIAFSAAARPRVPHSTSAKAGNFQDSHVYTIKEAGLQFEIPKGWKAETDTSNNVILSVEDGAINITFVVENNYAEVVTGMKDGLKEKVADMKSDGEPKQDTHNGMVHIAESGTGSIKDSPIIWSVDVLKATKTVTILTFGIQKVMEAHGDDYAKFVGSIKKL